MDPDPDRKKMSKSKGNVVVPNEVLEEVPFGRCTLLGCFRSPGADTATTKAR